MSKERYYTRSKASEGRKVYLADPATGKLTDDWLVIRSRWADEFQAAKHAAVQQAFTDAKDGTQEERKALDEDRKLSLVAALVGGWSFDDPCSCEAVKAFLREAPQLVDQIDRLSAKDSFFFRPASSNSSDGAKRK